jgi:hypothetical protein
MPQLPADIPVKLPARPVDDTGLLQLFRLAAALMAASSSAIEQFSGFGSVGFRGIADIHIYRYGHARQIFRNEKALENRYTTPLFFLYKMSS